MREFVYLVTLKELVENNKAAAVSIGIIFFLLTLVVIYFLYRSWFKEYKRIKEEKLNYVEGLVSKLDLLHEASEYIRKIGRSGAMTLILIELTNYADVISAFSEKDANNVMVKVAKKVVNAIPSTSMMTRYKEDQLLIVIKNQMDKDFVTDLIAKIYHVIAEPIKVIGNASVSCSYNAGVTFYPIHAESMKELLKNLNLSLYSSRKKGRNNFIIFSETTQEKEMNNLEYYQQITDGIKRKEFCLYYQPVLNSETKEVVSLEALLRWNHPTLGVIPPNKFINIMEQSGDIIWVGEWGFESLVKEYFLLKKNFPNRNLTCSINLSPKQLMDENLVTGLVKIVRKYHLEVKNFLFEISDVAYYGKDHMMTANIDKIHELGFGIAVDGFGADYGFLFSKDQKMPMDEIKLDRNFVADLAEPMNQKLLAMIQEFAKDKQVKVVALGVESKEMEKFLQDNGIYLAQGYLYSAPISDEDLTRYLENQLDASLQKGGIVEDKINQDQVQNSVNSEEKAE